MDSQDDLDFLWVRHCESASLEIKQGRIASAVDQWRKAFFVAQRFDDKDPRLVASMNNMGVAERLQARWDEAERLYRSALVLWGDAEGWVKGMRLRPRARSSLFHMRMERKHGKAYDRIAVQPYARLLLGGMAATRNNLAELLLHGDRSDQGKGLLEQALEERSSSLEEDDPGLSIIRSNLACLSEARDGSPKSPRTDYREPFLSQARRRAWIVDNPPLFTDEGRLMAAVLLAHIVPVSKV